MKYVTVITVFIALNVTYAQFLVAAEQPQAEPTAGTKESAPSGDELHFVSVLTLHGEIVAVDPAKRLVSVKDPTGELIKLEAKSEEDLAAQKVGDRVLVRYFEGAHIGKRERGEAVAVQSLKDGMISEEPREPSAKQHALSASVERVDALNQEVTLKGPDGSLETVMVSNPEYLRHIEIGDKVVITRPQGLALSLEKES
jgi:hypothetical protein